MAFFIAQFHNIFLDRYFFRRHRRLHPKLMAVKRKFLSN
jgi:hypothetical protein